MITRYFAIFRTLPCPSTSAGRVPTARWAYYAHIAPLRLYVRAGKLK